MALLRDLLLLCLVVPAVFVLSFGSALLQEKDTFSILLTAAQMQISGAKIGAVGKSKQRWLIRTGQRYAPLDDSFRKRGWVHIDQQGAVGVYKRHGQPSGQPIYVRFKMYTHKYMICQADRQP